MTGRERWRAVEEQRLGHTAASQIVAAGAALADDHDALVVALRALVEATERADNPGDYGVGSTDPVMDEARRVLGRVTR